MSDSCSLPLEATENVAEFPTRKLTRTTSLRVSSKEKRGTASRIASLHREHQRRRVSFDATSWEEIEVPMTLEEREARMPFGCSPLDEYGQEKPLTHVPREDEMEQIQISIPPTIFAQYWSQVRRASCATSSEEKHLECILCEKGPDECRCCIPDDTDPVPLGPESLGDSGFSSMVGNAVRGLGRWTTGGRGSQLPVPSEDEIEMEPETLGNRKENDSFTERLVEGILDAFHGTTEMYEEAEEELDDVNGDFTNDFGMKSRTETMKKKSKALLNRIAGLAEHRLTKRSLVGQDEMGYDKPDNRWRLLLVTGLALTAFMVNKGGMPSLSWLPTNRTGESSSVSKSSAAVVAYCAKQEACGSISSDFLGAAVSLLGSVTGLYQVDAAAVMTMHDMMTLAG